MSAMEAVFDVEILFVQRQGLDFDPGLENRICKDPYRFGKRISALLADLA